MNSIHLKNIKKDQVFFERGDYGAGMLKMIALEDARESGFMEHEGRKLKQWSCKAKNLKTEEVIDYLTTENCEHYGPKLFINSGNAIEPGYKLTKILASSEELVLLGALVMNPEVGHSLIMTDEDELLFRSSKIAKIEEVSGARIVETRNSKYKLEKI